MASLIMKTCSLGSITANPCVAICATFVRYIMVIHLAQQILIVEHGPRSQLTFMAMLVKSYAIMILPTVKNMPFLL